MGKIILGGNCSTKEWEEHAKKRKRLGDVWRKEHFSQKYYLQSYTTLEHNFHLI
jgi:hypothetical protein